MLGVHPPQFAGAAVERHHRPACTSGRIQHAVDGERRALEFVLGPRAEEIGLEAPRHFERVEVGGGDAIERRIMMVSQVAGVRAPVAGWYTDRGGLAVYRRPQ